MTYGATLAGRVTTESHEPVPSVQIVAYRSCAGMPLKGTVATSTDDLGAYRIFGLPAGEYVIEANTPQLGAERDIRQPSVTENDLAIALWRGSCVASRTAFKTVVAT
jgi:hypothetical protein